MAPPRDVVIDDHFPVCAVRIPVCWCFLARRLPSLPALPVVFPVPASLENLWGFRFHKVHENGAMRIWSELPIPSGCLDMSTTPVLAYHPIRGAFPELERNPTESQGAPPPSHKGECPLQARQGLDARHLLT